MKTLRKEIKVLIAGIGGGSHGLEIMKALRIANIKYRIYAADMNGYSLGLFKADRGYVIPSASHPSYKATLLNICIKEKIDVLFHGSEPDLRALSGKRRAFEREGIFMPFNSQEVINTCMNKIDTFNFLRANNIPVPLTTIMAGRKDISKVRSFPVIVKPCVNSGGSLNTFIAQDRKELDFFVNYIIKHKGRSIAQAYIGEPENEYSVGVLSDREGEIISCVIMKRLILNSLSSRIRVSSLKDKDRVLAVSSGISQGKIIADESIQAQCENISRILRSRGPLNIQCRFFRGKVYPFEINPRFSGTTYIRALAGVNEPDILIRKYVLKENITYNVRPENGLALRGLEEVFIRDNDKRGEQR